MYFRKGCFSKYWEFAEALADSVPERDVEKQKMIMQIREDITDSSERRKLIKCVLEPDVEYSTMTRKHKKKINTLHDTTVEQEQNNETNIKKEG